MKRLNKLTAVLVLLTVFTATATAQATLNDGFEDGDYTNSPEWTDSDSNYQPEIVSSSQNSNIPFGQYALNIKDHNGELRTPIDSSEPLTNFGADIYYDGGELGYSKQIEWRYDSNDAFFASLQIQSDGGLYYYNEDAGAYTLMEEGADAPYSGRFEVRNYDISTQTGDVYWQDNLLASSIDISLNGEGLGDVVIESTTNTNLEATILVDDVTYGVLGNLEPVINNAYTEPDPVEVGEQVTIYANSSDPDGNLDTVTAEIFQGNESYRNVTLNYNSQTGLYRKNNAFKAGIAEYRIVVTATDTEGATDTFSIPEEEIPIVRQPAEPCTLFECIIKDFQNAIVSVVNVEPLQQSPAEMPLWKLLVIIATTYIVWVMAENW